MQLCIFFPKEVTHPFLQLSITAFFVAQPLSKRAFALMSYEAQSACCSVSKNQSSISPSKALPLNRVSTSVLCSRPGSNTQYCIAVQPLVCQQISKLQISRQRPSSLLLPHVGVLQHLLFPAAVATTFPREQRRGIFTHTSCPVVAGI